MKLACCLALMFPLASIGTEVTPVQKVVQMLDGMLAQGKKEKHDEQVQFAAYNQFCDDTSAEKQRAIAEASQAIEVLSADIQKETANAKRLTKAIAEHEANLVAWAGDMKAATTVRGIEATDNAATHKDYSESIDALERAVAVLKKQAFDRKQASALVQVSALRSLTLIPPEAKETIDAFLAEDPLSVTAPEANAYEFQSQGVIDLLMKLHDKFMAERNDLQTAEKESRHAYEMLMQDLKAQTEQATRNKDDAASAKSRSLQLKADAKSDLEQTTELRAADQKYLEDTTALCAQKASDFESRQQLRAEELVAIEKAIEIISSAAVSGSAAKHLPALVQRRPVVAALAQLRNGGQQGQVLAEAAAFLQGRAQALHSRVLSAMAAHAAEDPFAKVKQMIKDLIVRLMEEAHAEAEHKGWCDTELATNEHTRQEKTAAVALLQSEIEQLQASTAKLAEEIADLSAAVAELNAAMAKATELREEEKETNAATVKDAQEAQTAVAQALTILKEFYAKAGEATALLQQQPVAPKIFDSPYRGMQAESGGVVGMLEVVQSDFARLEADTNAAEATAQKEFDVFMSDSAVDKAQKETDVEHKTKSKTKQTRDLANKQDDLIGTQQELDAAMAYFDKLKPSCVTADVSYDDRVARREEEIQSLQEALRILNGRDIA